jgi:hypothetical protein
LMLRCRIELGSIPNQFLTRYLNSAVAFIHISHTLDVNIANKFWAIKNLH